MQTWIEHLHTPRIRFKKATIVAGDDYLGQVLGANFLKGLDPEIEINAQTQWLFESEIRIIRRGGSQSVTMIRKAIATPERGTN